MQLLPKLEIVENPAIVEPDQGRFLRLISQRRSISEGFYVRCSIEIRTKDNEVISPAECVLTELSTDDLVDFLRKFNYRIDYFYMTQESALDIIPEFCRPTVQIDCQGFSYLVAKFPVPTVDRYL